MHNSTTKIDKITAAAYTETASKRHWDKQEGLSVLAPSW